MRRAATKLRILRLALRAEYIEEVMEAPPLYRGWEAVAAYFGETLEGYRRRRVGMDPEKPHLTGKDVKAALAAMGHPLTSTRVHLVVTHGYGGRRQ